MNIINKNIDQIIKDRSQEYLKHFKEIFDNIEENNKGMNIKICYLYELFNGILEFENIAKENKKYLEFFKEITAFKNALENKDENYLKSFCQKTNYDDLIYLLMTNYELDIEEYIDWSNLKDDILIEEFNVLDNFYNYYHREFMNYIPNSIYQAIKHKLKNITFWDEEISAGIQVYLHKHNLIDLKLPTIQELIDNFSLLVLEPYIELLFETDHISNKIFMFQKVLENIIDNYEWSPDSASELNLAINKIIFHKKFIMTEEEKINLFFTFIDYLTWDSDTKYNLKDYMKYVSFHEFDLSLFANSHIKSYWFFLSEVFLCFKYVDKNTQKWPLDIDKQIDFWFKDNKNKIDFINSLDFNDENYILDIYLDLMENNQNRINKEDAFSKSIEIFGSYNLILIDSFKDKEIFYKALIFFALLLEKLIVEV